MDPNPYAPPQSPAEPPPESIRGTLTAQFRLDSEIIDAAARYYLDLRCSVNLVALVAFGLALGAFGPLAYAAQGMLMAMGVYLTLALGAAALHAVLISCYRRQLVRATREQAGVRPGDWIELQVTSKTMTLFSSTARHTWPLRDLDVLPVSSRLLVVSPAPRVAVPIPSYADCGPISFDGFCRALAYRSDQGRVSAAYRLGRALRRCLLAALRAGR